MTQRVEYPLLTYLGNIDDPQVATDAANKRYVDAKTAGGNAVNLDGAGTTIGTLFSASGTNATTLVATGDIRTSVPVGTKFAFANFADPNGYTVYTVNVAPTLVGANTSFGITPAVVLSIPAGANFGAPTRTQITDISPSGTNIQVLPVTINGNQAITINAFNNAQTGVNVFSGVNAFSASATITTGLTVNPVIAAGSQIQLATYGSGGPQVKGINPSPNPLTLTSATDLAAVLSSAAFKSAFFINPGIWSITYNAAAGTILFTYLLTDNPVISGVPALQIVIAGTYTPTPTFTQGLVNVTGSTQAPTFKPLNSLQIEAAVANAGLQSQGWVLGWDQVNARIAWQAPSSSGVTNLNGLVGAVQLTAGNGIAITTPTSQTIQIANTGITSINTQTGNNGAITIAQGTGIGIASANNTITVTNTGSGGIASGNFTSFNAIVQRSIANQQQQQFAPTVFVNPNDTYGFYVDITGGGFLNETGTLLDGGSIGNTTYITTANRVGTNGLQFPVSTTYGEIECQLFTHTNLVINVSYNPAFGVPTNVGVEAYFALRGLTSTGLAPYQQNAVFPAFSFSGQDGVTFLYVVQPTLTFTSTGSGTGTVTIPAAQFRAISPQYTGLGGTGGGPEYIPYLRILLRNNSGASAPATSGSVNSYTGLPSMRVVVTLPGVGGSVPPLQSVVNTGNSLTNTTGNLSTIIFNDSVSGSSTTVDGTKLESRLHQFDGSTSGNVQIKAAATTTSYALTLPSAQATAASQTLINDGTGILSWGTGGGATNVLPYDTITWTNSGSLYASDKLYPIRSVSGTLDPTLSFITLTANLVSYLQGAAVIGVTSTGASVSGFYQIIAGIPSVQTVNVDRASGLVAGTSYTFQWRQGKLGTAGNYIDTMPGAAGIGTSVFFNELGYSGAGVTVTADAVNIGRYLLNITPTLNNILGNDNRTSGRNLIISQADQLRFQDTTQPTPFYIGFKAPASALTTNANFTLPSAVPTSTLPLVSDSTGVLSFSNTLALTSGSVANAPVNSTDIARLAEVQAATLGLKPQGPPNTNVHIAEVLVVGTYARLGGIGLDTLTTNSQLVVANVTPAVNDWVVLVNQTPFASLGYQNGSYVVTSTSAGGTVLTRTSVVPAFGNFYTSNVQFATNYGSGYENVTTGTITVGTTNIQFAKLIYGQPGSAINFHQPVRAATIPSAPINTIPSTLMPIDGYTPSLGDRILIKDLSSPLTSAAAGIYIVTNGSIWPRADDWNQNSYQSITAGAVIISGGSTNATTVWIQTQPVTTVGTSAQAFQLFSASGGSGTLQSVLIAGKSATTSASNNLTLFSDSAASIVFTGTTTSIPVLTFTGLSTSIGASASGQLLLQTNSGLLTYSGTGSTANAAILTESKLTKNAAGSFTVTLQTAGTDYLAVSAGGNDLRFIPTATAGTPSITVQGDTNTSLAIVPAGTGKVIIGNSTLSQLNIDGSAAATLKLQAFGTGTNIITQISGKGSSPSASAVQLATSFPNYWSFVGATTPSTGNPTIIAQPAGLGTTQNIQIAGLGNGNVLLGGLGSNCGISINGGNTTQAVVVAQSATSTNCDLVLGPSSGTSSVYIGDISNTAASLNVGNGNASRLTLSVISPNASAELFLSAKGAANGVYLSTQNANFIGVVGAASGGRPVLVSAGSTNTDLGLQATGTGVIYGLTIIQAANGVSFNSGTVSAAAYAAQLLAANSVLTAPTAMTAGTSTQILRSRGSGQSPGWSDNALYTVVRISSDTTLTANTSISPTLTIDTNQNALGLAISAVNSNQVTGLTSSSYYRITLVIRMISATAGTNTWHDFASSTGITSDPAYGTGVVLYLNQAVANDNESNSITGFATGTTSLRWISYASASTTLRSSGSYALIELLK